MKNLAILFVLLMVSVAYGGPMYSAFDGADINNIDNVNITSASNNDMLFWNSSASKWENTADIVVNSISPFGSIWWHDNDGVATGTDINISSSTVFANIASANINNGIADGTIVNGTTGSVTVLSGGVYRINSTQSFTTGTGAAQIDHGIGVNGTVKNKCRNQRSIGTGGGTDTGAASITCIMALSANDVVTIMVNSVAGETVRYEAFNLNVGK